MFPSKPAMWVVSIDVFVWVMPEGIEGLSDLTLAILDIATREDAVHHSGEDGEPSMRGMAGAVGAHPAQLSGSPGRAGVYARRSLKPAAAFLTCLCNRCFQTHEPGFWLSPRRRPQPAAGCPIPPDYSM